MNKKAQTPADVIVGIVLIGVMAVTLMIIGYVTTQIAGAMKTAPGISDVPQAQDALTATENLPNYYDWVLILALVGLAISYILLGYFFAAHPVFLIVYIVVSIVGFIVALVMQTIYNKVAEQAAFATISSLMPMVNHVMGSIGTYYTVLFFIALVATYGKAGGESV